MVFSWCLSKQFPKAIPRRNILEFTKTILWLMKLLLLNTEFLHTVWLPLYLFVWNTFRQGLKFFTLRFQTLSSALFYIYFCPFKISIVHHSIFFIFLFKSVWEHLSCLIAKKAHTADMTCVAINEEIIWKKFIFLFPKFTCRILTLDILLTFRLS